MGITSYKTTTIALAAGLICLLIYLRALSCGFVNFDDPIIILKNTDIRHLDLNLLYRVFLSPPDLWIPLAWLSLALDYKLWGLNPLGYHLTNIVLHAVNTGLIVLIADKIFMYGGLVKGAERNVAGILEEQKATIHNQGTYLLPATLLLAGLLWGLHPLRVESVVWVSERKDVLNGLFSFAAVLAYLRYADRHAAKVGAWSQYLFSLVLFACSLMSKSVSVVLPLMFLVLDWYPLRRLQRGRLSAVLIEKIPFFALSIVSAVLTIYFATHNNLLVAPQTLSIAKRIIISGNAVMEYCRLLLYPVGIIHWYYIPGILPLSYYFKAVFTVVLTGFIVVSTRKRPWICVSWLMFLLPLLPVLAFFQNGGQAFAARYTYLPSSAISIFGAGLVMEGCRNMGFRFRIPRLAIMCVVMLLPLFHAGITLRLISTWTNTGTLWTRYIQFRPIGRAYYYRSCYYKETGDYLAAVQDLTESIIIGEKAGMRGVFKLYALRGDAYLMAERYHDAELDFSTAISSAPRPAFYYYRGLAREAQGIAEAEKDMNQSGGEVGPIEWYVEPVVE